MRISNDTSLIESVNRIDESVDSPSVIAPLHDNNVAIGGYEEMEVALDRQRGIMWAFMNPKGALCFTHTLLRDLVNLNRNVERLYCEREPGAPNPVRFCVIGSKIPGVYNLGGDLAFFLKCVRGGDREALCAYAYACVEATYGGDHGLRAPCVSIHLVEGQALGGGFEAAMCGHVLIAERGARLGLPEINFNTFPGMGAFSFLARRIGIKEAEGLILSGRVYTAEQLHEMGVVDVLAEPGRGRAAASDFIAANERRQPLLCAIARVRHRVAQLTKQELLDITDIWVDTTMCLEAGDLRRIEFLLNAQSRRLSH